VDISTPCNVSGCLYAIFALAVPSCLYAIFAVAVPLEVAVQIA
jgi:hypothetical protein